MKRSNRLRDFLVLLGLTAAAVAVHGYHRGIEDMAVYLPAIKKLLNPALYPYDAAFFLLYIRMTVFHSFVATATRVTQIPLDWMIFLLHLISIFLFLLGCLVVIRRCVKEEVAQWAGVALVAALLTLPVTGTALFLLDQHLAPRTLASAFLFIRYGGGLEWSAASVTVGGSGGIVSSHHNCVWDRPPGCAGHATDWRAAGGVSSGVADERTREPDLAGDDVAPAFPVPAVVDLV